MATLAPGQGKKRRRSDSVPQTDKGNEVLTSVSSSLGSGKMADCSESRDPFNVTKHGHVILVAGPERKFIPARLDIIENISARLAEEISNLQDKKLDDGVVGHQPVEIEFPDESPDVIMIFCCLTHAVRLPEFDNIQAAQLLGVALFAVNYKCEDRLFYCVEYYLSRLRRYGTFEEIWMAYVSAYLLKKWVYFQFLGARLASKCQDSYLKFVKLIPDTSLATRLCCKL